MSARPDRQRRGGDTVRGQQEGRQGGRKNTFVSEYC